MLFSLVLPILYRETTVDSIQLGSSMQLYEVTIHFVLGTWIKRNQSSMNIEAIWWVLENMAVYILTHCPSGFMDTFDLTGLINESLREYYQKEGLRVNKIQCKIQSDQFVDLLKDNSVGFVNARGLDAYGFSHQIFQEYLTALSIIKSRTNLPDRVFSYIIKPSFHSSLAIAIEWIS